LAADVLQYANIYPGIRAVAPLLSLRFYFAAKLESLTMLYTFSGASLDKGTSETREEVRQAWKEKYVRGESGEKCLTVLWKRAKEKRWRIARISAGCKFLFAENSAASRAAKLTVV